MFKANSFGIGFLFKIFVWCSGECFLLLGLSVWLGWGRWSPCLLLPPMATSLIYGWVSCLGHNKPLYVWGLLEGREQVKVALGQGSAVDSLVTGLICRETVGSSQSPFCLLLLWEISLYCQPWGWGTWDTSGSVVVFHLFVVFPALNSAPQVRTRRGNYIKVAEAPGSVQEAVSNINCHLPRILTTGGKCHSSVQCFPVSICWHVGTQTPRWPDTLQPLTQTAAAADVHLDRDEQLTSLSTGQTIACLAKQMPRSCSLEVGNA